MTTTWSMPFTDTTNPGPQVGDGRPYTALEWRTFWKYVFCRGDVNRGVLKGVLNEFALVDLGANSIQVQSGAMMVNGAVIIQDTNDTIAPASAGAGTTRKDLVIAQLDMDGSGVGQNTVRITYKQGTAGAYPTVTQNAATVWEIEIGRYIIDDAGNISSLVGGCQYLRPAGTFDHGELDGLADDDHVQYYNAARHTKAVHDALGIDAATLSGYTAADFLIGGGPGTAAVFAGMMCGWGGTLGGSDGHRPIVAGVANEAWHLANGQTVNGIVTLDMRDLFAVGAGITYAVNATGGTKTLLAALAGLHDHVYGGQTVTTDNEANHTHGVDLVTGTPSMVTTAIAGGLNAVADGSHAHSVIGSTGAGSTHLHDISAHNTSSEPGHSHAITDSVGGAVILPPYRGMYWLTFVGATP